MSEKLNDLGVRVSGGISVATTAAKTPSVVEILSAALSEAATNLTQAAETLRRHGLDEKARMYDSDAQAARSALARAAALEAT